MTKEKISDALLAYSKEKILDPSVELKTDDNLLMTGIDSHSLLELVIFLERKFGIVLPDKALTAENLKSIETLSNCAHNTFKEANAK